MALTTVDSGEDLAKAIATARAGDRIRVAPRPDPFTANLTLTASGTRQAPITIECLPGVILAPRTGWQVAGDYWRIIGAAFDGYTYGLVVGENRIVEGLTVWDCSFANAGRAGVQLWNSAGTTLDGITLHNIRSHRPGIDTCAIVLYCENHDTRIANVHAEAIGSDPIHVQPQAPDVARPVTNLVIRDCVFRTDPLSGENGADIKGAQTQSVWIESCEFIGYHATAPDQDASGDAGAGLFIQLGAHHIHVLGCVFRDCAIGLRVAPGSAYDGITGPVHVAGCSYPGTPIPISRNVRRTEVYITERPYHPPVLLPDLSAAPDLVPALTAAAAARDQAAALQQQLDQIVAELEQVG